MSLSSRTNPCEMRKKGDVNIQTVYAWIIGRCPNLSLSIRTTECFDHWKVPQVCPYTSARLYAWTECPRWKVSPSISCVESIRATHIRAVRSQATSVVKRRVRVIPSMDTTVECTHGGDRSDGSPLLESVVSPVRIASIVAATWLGGARRRGRPLAGRAEPLTR